MEYVKVAKQSDLPSNQMMTVVVEGVEVLLTNVDGNFYAIANKCTHAGGSLAKGHLEGSVVKCPRHGAQFDVKTGKLVAGPKIGFLKLKISDEPCYSVKLEGDDILVGINTES